MSSCPPPPPARRRHHAAAHRAASPRPLLSSYLHPRQNAPLYLATFAGDDDAARLSTMIHCSLDAVEEKGACDSTAARPICGPPGEQPVAAAGGLGMRPCLAGRPAGGALQCTAWARCPAHDAGPAAQQPHRAPPRPALASRPDSCPAVVAGLRSTPADAPDAYLGLLASEDELKVCQSRWTAAGRAAAAGRGRNPRDGRAPWCVNSACLPAHTRPARRPLAAPPHPAPDGSSTAG